MSVESHIIEHYGAGNLLAAIETGIASLGKTTSTVTVEDLGPVDEFHIGGRAATSELLARLEIGPEDEVLDIGCGIGGTTRLLASTTGCQVTGVDLVPDYIEVARVLTDWTGLGDQIVYEVGSALDLPLGDSSFDAATMLHVGMNVENKKQMFAEARRVLRSGGRFGVYDIMRTADGDHDYPVPWASDVTTSFVAPLDVYRAALAAAGFDLVEVRERRDFALDFFTALRQRTAELGGPPPLGLHVIIGSATPDKIANMVAAISSGILAPVELVCQAV